MSDLCECPWCDIADIVLANDIRIDFPDGPPAHDWETDD